MIRYRELANTPRSEVGPMVMLALGAVLCALMAAWLFNTRTPAGIALGGMLALPAVSIGYALLQTLLSSTVITLDKTALRYVRTPIPDWIIGTIDAYRIADVKAERAEGRIGDTVYNNVVVITRDRQQIPIRRFIPQKTARFIAHRLRMQLHTQPGHLSSPGKLDAEALLRLSPR